MLEKQLSVLLATYLNRFICDLNGEQLRVSLWSGDVVLRDLELRSNILDQIALSLFQGEEGGICGGGESSGDAAKAASQALLMPFTVLKGVVRELVISVPWSALDKEPISVEVRGVEIVLGSLRGKPYNPDEDAARLQAVKQKQLQMFERGRLDPRGKASEPMAGSEIKFAASSSSKASRSYLETLIETITRNIHIVLRDVSIKYVLDYDGLANCLTCALVVAIEEVYVTTTDEEWEDRFVVDLSMPYCKKVVLSGIQVSVHGIKEEDKDTHDKGKDDSDTPLRWRETICIFEMEDHLTLHLRLPNKEGKATAAGERKLAMVSVTTMGPVKLRLSFGALGCIIFITDSLRNGLLGVNYRQQLHLLRGDGGGGGCNRDCNEKRIATWARRRWTYALSCVLDDVRRARNNGREDQCFIESVLSFCRRRREYCALWKRAQDVPWMPNLSEAEKTTMSALEEALTVEQIVFLRCLAYAELCREKQCMTQQKMYIADAIRRRKPGMQTDNSLDGRSKQQQEPQRRWWWWWFGWRDSAIGNTVGEVDECTMGVNDAFVTEWSFGHQFLQQIAAGRMRHSMTKSSSSSSFGKGGAKPIAIQVQVPQVEVEFYPHIWRRDVAKKKPHLCYLESLQQHIAARFDTLKCKYMMGGENPAGDGLGMTLNIGSVDVCFSGTLASPLLQSLEKYGEREGEEGEVAVEHGTLHSGPWLSVNVSETCSTVGVAVATTNITLQPLCELQWWVGGVNSFLAVLPEYTRSVPNAFVPSRSQCSSPPPPVMNVTMTEVILRMPLESGESEQMYALALHVPRILLSSMADHNQGSRYATAWHLSAGGASPIRFCCEGLADVLALSQVKVEVALKKGLSIIVRTDLELTIEPMVLALINDHLGNLVLDRLDTKTSLGQMVEDNDWMWRLESDDTIVIGDIMMTFPTTCCRGYLSLLYQKVCAREGSSRRIDAAPAPSSSAAAAAAASSPPPPLLQSVALKLEFVHVTLRSTNHEDIAHIRLPGRVFPKLDATLSQSPTSPSISHDAVTLEMTSSDTGGDHRLVMRIVDDLQITEALGGRQLMVFKALKAVYHTQVSTLSVELKALDVLLCHSLVNCVEVLLASCTSLRPIPIPPPLVAPPAADITTSGSMTTATNATAIVEEVVEVAVERINVRVLLDQVGRSAVMNLHDVAIRVGSATNAQSLRLQGKVEGFTYVAEASEEVKTFALLGRSCGVGGDARLLSFDCGVERTIPEDSDCQIFVSFRTSGGRINVFCAYWMELLSLSHGSTFLRLASLSRSQLCTAGFSRRTPGHSVRQHILLRREAAHNAAKRISTQISVKGEVREWELLFATDVNREIDVLDDATFVYLCGESAALTLDMVKNGDASGLPMPPFRAEVNVRNTYHNFPEDAADTLSPFILRASLIAESHTRLEPSADGSSYQYAEGGSGDMAIYVTIGSPHPDSSDNGDSGEVGGTAEEVTPSEAAVNMKLTVPMLTSLQLLLSHNILSSGTAGGSTRNVSCAPEEKAVTVSGRVSVLVTVPSVRFLLINGQDVFAIRAQLQLYSSTGTDGDEGGEKISKQIFHLRDLTVDDISPSRRVLQRDIPQWQQCGGSREVLPGCKRRLLKMESGCILIRRSPQHSTIELAFDGVTVHPVRCSLAALAGIFLSGDSASRFTDQSSCKTAVQCANPQDIDGVSCPSFLMILTVRHCAVYFEEPWEEPLAVLSLQSISARVHQLPNEKRVGVVVDEPVSLVPCHGQAVSESVLQWGDLVGNATEAVFLRVIATLPRGATREYQFNTPYGEWPQACCSRRVEVMLHSARLLLVDIDFLVRLLRFFSNEATAYADFLAAPVSVIAAPVTSVPTFSVAVRDVQMILPISLEEEEPSHETSWRFAVHLIELSNECVNTSVSNAAFDGTAGSVYCFSNVYSVKVWGARLDCGRLYPFLLPNTFLRAEVPILHSVYRECVSNVLVTPDDCAYLHSTYVFVSPSPSSASSFCRRLHIKTEDKACFSFSALHVRDALRALPLLLHPLPPPTISDSPYTFSPAPWAAGDVPSFYTDSLSAKDSSSYATSVITVDLPCFSIRLTEGGHVIPAAGGGGGKGNTSHAALAELFFFEVVTLSISLNVRDEMRMLAHLSVKGAFELLDGNGVAVLFRWPMETHDKQGRQQPCAPLVADVAGVQLEIIDTLQERRMRLNSHGIVVSLHPHTVDFMLLMHNLVTHMHREGFFDDPFIDRNTMLRVTESGANAPQQESSSSAAVAPTTTTTTSSATIGAGGAAAAAAAAAATATLQKKRSVTLTVCISMLSVILENTALLEARNMEASLSWDTDDHKSDSSAPYSFVIRELSLQRIDGPCDFAFVSGLEVSLGVGQVSIRTKRFIVKNYDTVFYVDLWDRVEALHDYIKANVKFSKKHEDGFKQLVIVTLMDFRVCFLLSRKGSMEGGAAGGGGGGGGGAGVEVVLPIAILKHMASTTGQNLTFETECGVIRYRRPHSQGLLPPFVKNIKLTCFLEENFVTHSRAVVVNLGSVEAMIPLGDTLQSCVEAVAQAVLPLLASPFNLYRSDNTAVAVPLMTPLNSDKLEFSIPLVSLHVCTSQSDEVALVAKPTILFGVSVHTISFERSRTGVNERTLAKVLSVTSTVDTAIQEDFVSVTAPRGALDMPSKWALYFWREISSPGADGCASSSFLHPPPPHPSGDGVEVLGQLPARFVNVIARAHAVKITVSPELLSILNEHVLMYIASGVYRSRSTKILRSLSRNARDVNSTQSYNSGSDIQDRLLTITCDLCLKSDLVLGGARGSRMRFVKKKIESNPSNRLTVKGVNHAKVLLSLCANSDGALQPPIVVDPGLTVVFQGVPFVFAHGKLMDYVELGSRSVFLVTPEPLAPTATATATATAAAAAVTANHLSFSSFSSTGAAFSATLPLNTARWYNLKVSLDASIDVVLQLWSKHQKIAVSGEAYARYELEKNCFEGSRGVRDFMDESGEVALSNVSIRCDSGSITRVPARLVVHVKHHKLNEDPTNAGMTVVRAILPSTSFKLSVAHLRLLYGTLNQLQKGLKHISSTMGVTNVVEPVNSRDACEPSVSSRRFHSSSNGIQHSASTEPSLVWSRDGELAPLVEFGISAPHIELILTNDFYRPEVTITLTNISLLAKGNRCLNRMACAASMSVSVIDFPQFQSSREILALSPEVALEYTRYTSGGFALQGALTFHKASVTLPLVTLLRLIRCHHAMQRTCAYSFRNNTGIPLTLLPLGTMKQGQEESKEFCHLPPGELVRVGLFHYNQTRFRVILDDIQRIDKHHGSVNGLGVVVDFSMLQHGATYRFPFEGHPISMLHGVMRLDEVERVVDITTSVVVKNELMEHLVCFPANHLEPFVVRPKESRYATLSCLQQPFSLTVGEWRLKTRNELITLGSFISAFSLLSDGRGDTLEREGGNGKYKDIIFPRHAYMDGDDTLIVPLTLTKEQPTGGTTSENRGGGEFGVLLVLKRIVAVENELRTSRFLPRYDVEMQIWPLVTVINLTGTALAVSIASSSSSEGVMDEARFLRGKRVEFNCFTNYWEASGEEEKVQEEEGEGEEEGKRKGKESAPVMRLVCELANSVQLRSSEPLALTFSGIAVVRMEVMGAADAVSVVALVVERALYGKFLVRVAAIVVNALPFSVQVCNESNMPVLGQKKGLGLLPGKKLPVMLPVFGQVLPQPDSTLYLRVRAGSTEAKLSQLFACKGAASSVMLQSIDGGVVRIFRAWDAYDVVNKTEGGILATPVVRLESAWVMRNKAQSLSLLVRCVGLADLITIGPQSEAELTTFALSSAADPLLQVRYSMDGEKGNNEGLFAWSEPVKLVTLSSSILPISMKHYLRATAADADGGDDRCNVASLLLRAGVTTFTSVRVPTIPGGDAVHECFACLSIASSRQKGGQYLLQFTLDRAVPVVVENRTERLLRYEAIHKSLFVSETTPQAYIIEPFTDGVTCFEGDSVTPVMKLTLFGGDASSQSCTIDLAKAAAARGAVKTSRGMFALCTYDHSLQRYYVSVTTDRSLESTLVFQPRYIVHVETFIRLLSLHIASICVPKSETSLRSTPLTALVVRDQLRLGGTITANSSNAEVLSALKCRELDVVQVQAVDIYCALSVNEKHLFGRIDVNRAACIDCTSPHPLYPVVVGVNVGDAQFNSSDGKCGKPSLSVKLHAMIQREEDTVEEIHRTAALVTIPLQYLRIDVAPITLKLADTLLFMLRQAGTCVLEEMQLNATGSRAQNKSSVESLNVAENARKIKHSEDVVVYNWRIEELVVSRINLDLTLTRRGDGRFDPFSGSTLSSWLIPSVERAPLSISGVIMRDVIQRSSSMHSALISVLWPSYRNQLVLQLYKIVGSLEALGNPIALVNGWQKGVRSLVVEASETNLMKGARDFLFASVSSTLHSVGLLSRVGGRTAATISCDSDWLEAMDEDGRLNDSLRRYGVLWGMAEGLRGGIEGVVSRPLRGARASGLAGFCAGVATGAVGLLTRPVVGILDGFGNTAEFYSKLLQEPDCIPRAHQCYLESNRNFNAASTALVVESSTGTNSSGTSPAAPAAASEGTTNTAFMITPVGNPLELNVNSNALQKAMVSSTAWSATGSCEFVSLATYDSLQESAKCNGLKGIDAARFLVRSAGINNYALYASWASFVTHTTPEEFYDWVHIAIAAALKKELEAFLSSEYGSMGVLQSFFKPQHPCRRDFSAAPQGSENMLVSMEAEAVAMERARNIKNTLGLRDLSKYVSLHDFLLVCSLDEVKRSFSPETIHTKISNLLLPCARNSLLSLLARDAGT